MAALATVCLAMVLTCGGFGHSVSSHGANMWRLATVCLAMVLTCGGLGHSVSSHGAIWGGLNWPLCLSCALPKVLNSLTRTQQLAVLVLECVAKVPSN